ncbi:FkbM family methyltransferase [Jannaschia marina]|uniref:FkbM family methyltransferase n=1 Tax=Jannaschia marina TaxID=2741674 RepID=UPI0015CD10EB|nr:FkbM family methyltransferase [Jannaschia marina]
MTDGTDKIDAVEAIGTEEPLTRRSVSLTAEHRQVRKRMHRKFGDARGADLVARANAMTRRLGLGPHRWHHDAEADLYAVEDAGRAHWISSPARLWTQFHGRAVRAGYLADQYLLDAVPLAPGDWVVDVGANTGDLSLCFTDLDGPTACEGLNIVAFEPAPGEFAALERNLAGNPGLGSAECHNLALWSEAKEALTFYLKPDSADSSLVPIAGATGQIEVPTARLDAVLPARDYKLLKLEAEGVEPEILQGAAGILHRFAYVTADVGFERGARAASTLPQVVNTLTAAGFEVVGYNGGRHILLFRNART